MERYRMINGALVPPLAGGVTVEGRVISNFAARVKRDAAFAAANGYYPIAESEQETCDLLEEETVEEFTYILKGGMWVPERGN